MTPGSNLALNQGGVKMFKRKKTHVLAYYACNGATTFSELEKPKNEMF